MEFAPSVLRCTIRADRSIVAYVSEWPSLSRETLQAVTQQLLRFLPDALIVIDAQGRICFANESVRQLFGHEPDALLGCSIEVLVPARFRARHGQHFASFMQAPKNREMGARVADLFAVRADGFEFSAGIRLAPFRMGDETFIAAAIRDMTEQRSINEELVVARTEAERANRAKSRFLATASHDLRQPMQTIRLLNAAMLRVVPQQQLRELLEQQGGAIESMTRLLNALLDISRLESGAVQPQLGEVFLADVFASLRADFASVARARGLDLVVEDSTAAISTDRTLLMQLLQNLVGNALKYTERGSVKLRCFSQDGGIVVAIEDTGIGIPADKLERVFDEYYQVDTHGAKRLGVGLGLAIVKEVARLLGICVRITSSLGEGTKVFITVPERLVLVGAINVAPNVSATARGPARKPDLLLVEDNDGVRLATETFLRFEGYEVRSAATAAEAQSLLSRCPADIVITDYHLDSDNTGLDLLIRIRQHLGRAIPGIILSGDVQRVLRAVKSPLANCRFLSKPVEIGELIGAIDELNGA